MVKKPILHSTDGPIAIVVIDNPDKLNALSLDAWAELGRVMRLLSGNGGVRCVVVRGSGDKAFSAGADITEFPEIRSTAAQATACWRRGRWTPQRLVSVRRGCSCNNRSDSHSVSCSCIFWC